MIYRETHTINYTVVSNSLISSKLPSDAKNVLTWLLSKPKNWKLIKVVIAEALGLSKHRVQQAITLLRTLGYLRFFRHKDGSGHWDVYESPRPQYQPQTRVVKPSPSMPTKAFSTDTTNTDYQKVLKTTTPSSQDEPKNEGVVVPLSEIEINATNQTSKVETLTLTKSQPCESVLSEVAPVVHSDLSVEIDKLPVAKAIKPTLIKTLASLTLTEAKSVLAILSRAIVLGKVQNPVGYLVELVRAAKNGSLTPVAANQSMTLDQRLAKERQRKAEESKRGVMDNEQWSTWFASKYGVKPSI